MKSRIAGLGVALAVLGALVVPSTASATVSCTFAANVLTITAAGPDFDIPSIQRSDNNIQVREVPGPATLACTGGTPTVTTTETINFVESGGGASEFTISIAGGHYTPGVTNEAGGSDEIEFNVTTDGFGDTIILNGNSDVQNYRFGQNAGTLLGNLNGDEVDGLDADVTATGIERLLVNGLGESADTFTANGGAAVPGSTAPAGVAMRVSGQAGNDVLTGGSNQDSTLDGGDDNDILTSGANGGTFRPGPGDDTVAGGAGAADVLSYFNLPSGVTLDLGVATPQDSEGQGTETITGIEGFEGSNGDDAVTGTAGANTLHGRAGNDTFDGGPGADSFSGGGGTDTISFADDPAGVTFSLGIFNTAQPGAGNDTLVDAPDVGGLDDLIENLNGSGFADTLTGDAAGNQIEGGLGADAVSALAGVDTVLARDGVDDATIDCGGDAGDSAQVDALPFDDPVVGCPALDRTPPATDTPLPAPPAPPPPGATGQRAEALKKCKKKKSKKARKKCKKRAQKLPQ